MEEEKKDIQIIDNNFYLSDEKFQNYWFWHGLWKSKSVFAKNSLLLKNEKRQKAYLIGQIIKHYFKNFFLFPIWLLSLLVPSCLKGKNNLWTNLKTIIVNKEFKPLRVALLSQVVFILILACLGYFVFYKKTNPSFATSYTFIQNDWSSSASSTVIAINPDNNTNWNYYESGDSSLNIGTSVSLLSTTSTLLNTNDTDFVSGTFSNTEVSGVGSSASISLTGGSTSINNWLQPDGVPTTAPVTNRCTFYTSNTDYIYIYDPAYGIYRYSKSAGTWTAMNNSSVAKSTNTGLACTGGYISDDYFYAVYYLSTGRYFYRYTISTNTWTARASLSEVPQLQGTTLFYNTAQNYLYYFPANYNTTFYKYNITANSWTTKTASTTMYYTGMKIIKNDTEDKLYMLSGGSTSGFYSFAPSTETWQQLQNIPSNVYTGSQMIRDGVSDYIYALPGNNSAKIYRYTISTDSWDSSLTDAPGSITQGSWAQIDGVNGKIYVGARQNSTDFYIYDIGTNSWTSSAGPMVGGYINDKTVMDVTNGKIYDIEGTGVAIYDITGGTWNSSIDSVLSDSPISLATYRSIKDGDNIFYFGTADVYRYTISTDTWTQMTSVYPTGGSIRNLPTYDEINNIAYFSVSGSSSSVKSFYSYNLGTDTWTKLADNPYGIYQGWTIYPLPNTIDGAVYVTTETQGRLYKYTIANNTWSTLPAAPSAVGRQIYANGDDTALYMPYYVSYTAYLYKYNLASGTWSTMTPPSGNGQYLLDSLGENFYFLRADSVSGQYYTYLYKYNITTDSWNTNLARLSTAVGSIIYLFLSEESSDILYGLYNGILYTYTISTNTWAQLATPPYVINFYNLMQDPAHHAVLGTGGTKLYKYVSTVYTYNNSGDYTSDVIDNGLHEGFTTLDYTATLNSQTLTVDVRAGDSSTVDGTWTSWITGVVNGGDISGLGSHRYVQYRVNLSTNDTSVTPTLDDVTFNYYKYNAGSLVSSPFNTNIAFASISDLSWNATTSSGNDIQFQLRTSADNLTWSGWMGPDGTSGSYFTDNTGGQAIPAVLSDHSSDQYFQYQVFLITDGVSSPTLTSVTVHFSPPDPPSPPTITDSVITTTSIQIVWNDVTSTDYYTISTNISGQESITTTSLSYTFSNLSPGTSYNFQIQATDIYAQDSGYSDVSVITTALPGTLSAPTITSFDVSSTTIQANWSSVVGANHYTVSSTANISADTTSNTYFQYSDLLPNTSYTWKLNTVDNFSQNGPYSAVTSTYTNPAQPSNITALANGQTAASLSWSNNGNPINTVYKVYEGSNLKGSTTSTSYTIIGLTSGTSYTFTVRAIYNSDNISYVESELSNIITTAVPAVAVVMDLPPGIEAVSFKFNNNVNEHSARIDSISNVLGILKAHLTLHSNTVSVTLGQGESQNVDLSGNGSNDITVTMNSVSSESASFTLTAISQGGGGVFTTIPSIITSSSSTKAVIINNNELTTSKKKVTLNFNIKDAKQMAISNDSDFENISFENYTTKKDWILTSGNGIKIIYVKFRSADGGTIVYSSTIDLTGQSLNDPNSTSILDKNTKICSLTKGKAYKTKNNPTVYYLTEDCTKRAFRNPANYFHYFTSWNQVKVITNVELNNIVNDKTYFMTLDQNQSLKEDSLIKTSNDPKVYIIQNNERHLIPNEIIFEANGFKWNNILDVDYDLLDKYLETEVLE